MQRLNLGSGHVRPKNWVNIDKIPSRDTIVADIRHGLPFEDNHFDFILMNHTLQSFHYDELPLVLEEVKRVLKIGATLRILTPDFDKVVLAYINRNRSKIPISEEIEPTLDGAITRYLFWHGDTRCAFNLQSLGNLLHRNGFKDIQEGKFGACELDSREEESLIMECVK